MGAHMSCTDAVTAVTCTVYTWHDRYDMHDAGAGGQERLC